MATTMTHIAQEANVSVSLVSRLLRDDETLKVTDATRQRIMETCQRLGGVQSLSWTQKQSKKCHVVVPLNRMFASRDTAYLAHRPDGRCFQRHLQDHGGQMSVVFFDDGQCEQAISGLMDDRVYCQGLLLYKGIVGRQVGRLIEEHHFPHICLDVRADRYQVNTLFTDELAGLRQVVDHLTELGHQKIGYLGPKHSRYPYFVAVLHDEHLALPPEAICQVDLPDAQRFDDELWRKTARDRFMTWIQTPGGQRCTALHCHNDAMALGVIDAMQELGMTPGVDLSVIGFDNAESRFADIAAQPILTTIHNPLEEVGQRAAERLIAQCGGEENKIMHERVPTRLIVRQTTGPAPNNEKNRAQIPIHREQ